MRNQNNLQIYLISVCLFYFSCSNQPIITDPNYEGDPYVFCTLSSDLYYQQVLVGRMIPEHFPQNISNALVTIHNNNQSVVFQYINKGYYGDLDRSLKINFGETCYLKVLFPDGQLISGRATPPGPFDIFVPALNDTIVYFMKQQLDTAKLSRVIWTESKGARFYQIGLFLIDSLLISPYYFSTKKNNIYFPEIMPHALINSRPLKGIKIKNAELIIIAHDSSRYEFSWQRRSLINPYSDFTPQEEAEVSNELGSNTIYTQTNLSGGLGYFNAKSIQKRKIILKIYMDWP